MSRMHCSPSLINAVAAVLTKQPATALQLRNRLVGTYSTRAIRYAVAELIKQGRAKRIYERGPVKSVDAGFDLLNSKGV